MSDLPLDPLTPLVRQVLVEYEQTAEVENVEELQGNGGFSGSSLWRVFVRDGNESYCVRCWTENVTPFSPDCRRVIWAHQVLRLAIEHGVHELAAPIFDRKNATLQIVGERIWELSRWVEGAADFHQQPSDSRLRSATQVIARFHNAVREQTAMLQPVPAIAKRFDLLQQLREGKAAKCRAALDDRFGQQWKSYGIELLDRFDTVATPLHNLLAANKDKPMRLQACLGDVWHDHLFFQGEECVGVIDFGAMRVCHVASDLARMLGSLCEDDAASWATGLAAYREVAALSEEEEGLVKLIDRANVFLSGLNWLQWLYVEGRVFEDLAGVEKRLEYFSRRSGWLCASGM